MNGSLGVLKEVKRPLSMHNESKTRAFSVPIQGTVAISYRQILCQIVAEPATRLCASTYDDGNDDFA